MSDRDGHPVLHPTRIDIPMEIRLYLMTLLNRTLACTVDLRSQVKQASWAVYACAIQRRFDEYLHLRTMYYGREERWPSSPFWQRRQAVQDASD